MRPIQSIIFLSHIRFAKRDVQRFGIDILQKNGFDVGVWEISEVVYPDAIENVALPETASGPKIRIFSQEKDLLNAISASRDSLYICLVDLHIGTLSLFRHLSQQECRYAVLYLNPFPIPRHYYSATKKYSHYLKRVKDFSPREVFLAFANKLLLRHFRLFGVRPADISLLGGAKSTDFLNTAVDATTERVWLHSLDYDAFLDAAENPQPIDPHLCVFIEAYFSTDPDRFYHSSTSVFDPDDRYYAQLRSFFDYIEKKEGVRVVIAEHPKKHPEINVTDYGSREMVCGRTVELVQRSRFVLSHDSNAVNYPILFKKPILFLVTRDIVATSNGQNVMTIAETLEKGVISMDEPLTASRIDRELAVDTTAYDRYISNYIKKSPDQEPCWQIFADFLKNYYS